MARGDIFPLNAAREPFFVKMWPAYETEFETPELDDVFATANQSCKAKEPFLNRVNLVRTIRYM